MEGPQVALSRRSQPRDYRMTPSPIVWVNPLYAHDKKCIDDINEICCNLKAKFRFSLIAYRVNVLADVRHTWRDRSIVMVNGKTIKLDIAENEDQKIYWGLLMLTKEKGK
jgi:hypothetical protein